MTKKKNSNQPASRNSKSEAEFLVPLEELLEAGCHFGHQSKRWHPKMAPFIWEERSGVHIFDLAKTQSHLQKACLFIKNLTSQGKKIIFIGTKRQASSVIKEEAEKAGIFYVSNRWLGGTITNWEQIQKSLKRLRELKEKKESGTLNRYTKRERVLFDREIARLTRIIGGIEDLHDIPDIIFVVDVKREEAAVAEARIAGIPVIAIVDSNCDPGMADIVIPANDDAVRSIRLITAKISQAVLEGRSLSKPKEAPIKKIEKKPK